MSATLAWDADFGANHAGKLGAMKPAPVPSTPPSAPVPATESDECDAELRRKVEAIRHGDEHALGRVYDLTVSRVYGLALRITGKAEAAEEVVEDVYMQIWRTAQDYHAERGKVIAWLLTICRSRAIDYLRRKDVAESMENPADMAPHEQGDDPQDLLAATQQNTLLHAAIERLSPVERQLLSLAFFRGYTHEEIAAHSRLPLGSVKTYLRRALSELRSQLGTNI